MIRYVLLSFAMFLLSFVKFYYVLQRLAMFCYVLLRFSMFCYVLLCFWYVLLFFCNVFDLREFGWQTTVILAPGAGNPASVLDRMVAFPVDPLESSSEFPRAPMTVKNNTPGHFSGKMIAKMDHGP